MKKINSKLQFTKTTVRVLQGSELTNIHGGAGGAELRGRGGLSDNPTACARGNQLSWDNNPKH